MRWMLSLFLLGCLPGMLQAQRIRVPLPQPDTTPPVLTAQDSAWFRARTSPIRKPYSDCSGLAFQTCASGEIEARLSADATAFGVLMTRAYDGKSAFLWRITGRVAAGGGGGAAGGRSRGGRGGRGARGGGRRRG